ncbi:hypothetical protein ACJU26_08170 [Acidithiobacillus sp. M4-SHS-6]|uniref:hypothetical protein n=1 Tax=Acidithiobacillus sp. M4-SHS-6 TaxID=3383024 RepID=UPI0039BDAF5E
MLLTILARFSVKAGRGGIAPKLGLTLSIAGRPASVDFPILGDNKVLAGILPNPAFLPPEEKHTAGAQYGHGNKGKNRKEEQTNQQNHANHDG